MLIRKLFFISAIYILLPGGVHAQAQDFTFSEQAPVTIGPTLLLQSEILSAERKIFVSLPDDYATSSKRYPVIYLLDAQYFFEFQYAYGVINALEFMEKIPQVILVGVYSEDRTTDMTQASQSNAGNADNFIEFFSKELQVFIDQQYRTQPYKILIGQSAGALFALHTLFQTPATFNGYIAMSPALQYDNGKTFDELKKRMAAGVPFNNTLFTSLASEDGGMRDYYEQFLDLLSQASPDGLNFSHMSYPDESHTSTILPGIQDGLLAMYQNWAPPESVNSLESLVSHYQKLSEHYAYTIAIPVTHASNLGFKLVNNGDPEGALEVFEYRLANINQDAIAYYSVGFALRRLGRLTEALAMLDKAIELGPGTDMYSFYLQFRDEISQELQQQ